MPIPDFVAALRARVGTDLLWMPGVSGIVADAAGNILLGRRADTGQWAVISGILEPGEHPAVGLAREVAEETNVRIVVDALVAVTVTDIEVYPNGDHSQYLDMCFACRPASHDAAQAARVNDEESLDVGWFDPRDPPVNLADASRARIGHYLRYVEHPDTVPYFVRPL